MDKNGKPTKESNSSNPEGALALVTENKTSKIIIVVAVVIFFILAALIGLRMMVNKSKMALINEAMARNDAIKNADNELSDTDKKAVQMKNLGDKVNYAEVNRDSSVSMTNATLVTQQAASGAKLQQYGDQYDPNQDFAIFAAKDKAVGGHINLREKMNLADNKSERSEQSSIDIEERGRALKFKMSQRKVERQKTKDVATKHSTEGGSPNHGSQSPLAS